MKYFLQIRNSALFLYALFVLAFWGSRKATSKDPRKILIVQRAKLGDMVCTTPLFRAIKEKYPNAQVYVAGDTINQQVLKGNSDVDHYITLSEGNLFQIARKLRKENIDFGCVTAPDFLGLLLLIFSRIPSVAAPRVVGGSANQTRTYRIISRFVNRTVYAFGAYAPRERLRLLEIIGIYTDNTKKYVFFSTSAEKNIQEILKRSSLAEEDFLVGISPSVANRIKQWPAERFGEVANYLIENYNAKIVTIGGTGEVEEADTMCARVKKKDALINTVGKLSIDELKALISHLDLFVSVDTGPIYIAEALSIPTIDIVGPMDEREQPPIGKLHRVVVSTDRIEPATHILNSRTSDKKEARRQALSISVSMVEHEIDSLLTIMKINKV